jgi:hypothetical protein
MHRLHTLSTYAGLRGILKLIWDFLSKVIWQKVPNRSSDSWSKAALNIDSNSKRNLTFKVFQRYGPLWRILLSAVGHCGRFGYALWATAADLVIRYGPLRRIWLCTMGHCGEWSSTVKICIDFSAMGHSAGFGYALWAIAQGLVIRYGPYRRIQLSAICRCAAFGYALWAIAQNQLP